MGVPSVFDFLLLSLASFRLTRLLVFDKITEFIRRPFFVEWTEVNQDGVEETYIKPKEKGLQSWIGELLSCYWCMGVWSALGLYGGLIVYPPIFQPIIVVLAIAGLAALIETIVHSIQR
ncbi:MAG TPA: DUF1360 domain-containing protein [Bacillus sp. (in: firmicutes)]|uniref:DUF1360 domain-containing protein n=1 Tax=Bacillus litorisediminis TaxID=2922713 RepID=UPI001FAC6117|nr:DUF1360 domain-containing protein [Bacillus litorisediminis]HWO77529.1 DUF1360 domain-containing protein [Bacillus sp. (in: firmicutes)]